MQNREIIKKIKPERFEDLAAFMALSRPGPMEWGMLNNYLNRKRLASKLRYDIPQLKEILQETYGVITYREQIMRIACVAAKLSVAESYLMFQAMHKQMTDEIAQSKEKFIAGCNKNHIPITVADKIFKRLERSSREATSKNNCVGHATQVYQLAYLKVNFPLEFLAASITDGQD